MDQTLSPVKKFRGSVRVPGDKSISHRALMLAALADGVSNIKGLSPGLDVASTAACMRALGSGVERAGDDLIQVRGVGPECFKAPETELDAGNSGTTIRLLSGILAGQNFTSRITGDQYLQKRPMRRVIDPLTEMGARVESAGDGYPPLVIAGGGLNAITYKLPVPSAQVKSCVLLAGLFAQGSAWWRGCPAAITPSECCRCSGCPWSARA